MKTLAELILSAGERAQLEYDGLRYRALLNEVEHGRIAVKWMGGDCCYKTPAGLDYILDGVLNRGE